MVLVRLGQHRVSGPSVVPGCEQQVGSQKAAFIRSSTAVDGAVTGLLQPAGLESLDGGDPVGPREALRLRARGRFASGGRVTSVTAK